MLVSVLLVAHNHENYIQSSIRSIVQQTYTEFELLVVDSGSTDSTFDALSQMTDPRMTCLRVDNRGPSHAFNTAFSHSKGEYVAILSGDDIAEPNRLERQLAESISINGAPVFSQVEFIGEYGQTIRTPHYLQGAFDLSFDSRRDWMTHFLVNGNCLNATTFFCSADNLKVVCSGSSCPFHPALLQLQDFDLWLRLAARFKLRVIPEKLMKYRIRANQANLSAPSTPVAERSRVESFLLLSRFLTELPLELEDQRPWIRETLLASPHPAHRLAALTDIFHAFDRDLPPESELDFARFLASYPTFIESRIPESHRFLRATRAFLKELRKQDNQSTPFST